MSVAKEGMKDLMKFMESLHVKCVMCPTYVRFQTPVPPSLNKEPVYEFSLKGKQDKYLVDFMAMSEDFLFWVHKDEYSFCPLANVTHGRMSE